MTPDSQLPVQKADARLKRVVFSVGVILLLLIILGFFYPIGNMPLWKRIYTVWGLRDLYVLDISSDATHVETFGIRSTESLRKGGLPEGTILEYAGNKSLRIGVVQLSPDVPRQVVILSPEYKELTSTDGIKSPPAVSAKGDFVAFSTIPSSNEPILSHEAWELHLINLSTGEQTPLGVGYDAQFFTRDNTTWLLYVSETGFTYVNTSDPYKSYTTAYEVPSHIGFSLRVSPDAKYVAFKDFATQRYSVYETEFQEGYPLRFTPLQIEVTSYEDVVFADNENLFALRPEEGNSGIRTLVQVPLTGGETRNLYTLQGGIIMRLINTRTSL